MNSVWLSLFLPLAIALAGEHVLMAYVYKKPSSLQRLFKPSNSAKADITFGIFYYLIWEKVRNIALLITAPGLAILLTNFLTARLHWSGLLGLFGIRDFFLCWLIWLLVIDLATYVAHVLMHNVPFLWNFHKLHHSATEMNIITGLRTTVSERIFNELAIFLLVVVILGLPSVTIAFSVMFARSLIDLVQHSDLPWDYGPLDYIIASPRFHRLHHSSHAADYDANYSDIFSIWDYIFGTVAARYRQSRAIADTCPLGLSGKKETATLNENWFIALLRTTPLLLLYEAFADRAALRSRWRRFHGHVGNALIKVRLLQRSEPQKAKEPA